MCGIVCAFDVKESTEVLRPQLLEMSKKIRHRGPDWSGIYSNDKAVLAHERLAIVDPASGKQPLLSKDGKLVLAANGEIYNHRELRKEFEGKYDFQTESDCEVILALYCGSRSYGDYSTIYGLGPERYFLCSLRTQGFRRYMYKNRTFPSRTLFA